ISNYADIEDLMFLYKEKEGMTLYVMLKETHDNGKTICVVDSEDLNNDGCNMHEIHDDYFGCQIIGENPLVGKCVPNIF
ncbi:hypothetical protein, partial [Proteus mirabilis]|uniref:hypothetical protein n=1 Tax=Proteus mirabilis TaxID=584 RepID=UPI001C12D786